MPKINLTPRRYNPGGEAKAKETRRNIELERDSLNQEFPTFMVKGFVFRPYYNNRDTIQIHGPLCPTNISKDKKCLAPMTGGNDETNQAECIVCGKSYEMPHSFREFRNIAHRAWEGMQNAEVELITVDLPFDSVKDKQQDDTRWVKVMWSQKNGRNQAIIYFIEKDAAGEKTHIFADMDREEIRYDAGDVPPGRILAKVKAEFKNTTSEIEYKEPKPGK